jgi:hypothetical protein
VKYYFMLLIMIIVVVPIYNYIIMVVANNTDLILSLKDIILTYAAAVGPTFGLVIAYYFKSTP